MPIVYSQIIRNHDRGGGRISVYEQHTDHIGKIHDRRYRTFAGDDVNANLAANAAIVEVGIIENEIQRIRDACQSGTDPATITSDYLTEAQRVRACMEAFVTGNLMDIKHMLTWVESFTTQKFNSLGFTSAERGKINAREGSVGAVVSLFDTDLIFKVEAL